jgi:hypothetical protein
VRRLAACPPGAVLSAEIRALRRPDSVDPNRYITQFDSASSMLYALAGCMRRQPFAGRGIGPQLPAWTAPIINQLPGWVRDSLYTAGGWWGAIPDRRLNDVDEEAMAAWAVNQYDAAVRYPAAMVGSSNGAAIHLCAALGIPWLPQTVLIAVRRDIGADELKADAEWGRARAQGVVRRNPSLHVHQMHDPLQDRLMVRCMGYFRVKRSRMGQTYETFLTKLPAGSTLFTIECRLPWPVAELGERHVFQVGGLGGLTPEEYLDHSPRVEQFLQQRGARQRSWDPPAITATMPEAEWGFLPELGADVERFAKARGCRVRRIIFEQPEALSPFVADLYRWWYARRGLPTNRLLIECFGLLEPWWALRTGSVPFWMAFTAEPSADAVDAYLDRAAPFDEMFLMLMSNGAESIGLTPIARWRSILGRARQRGEFLGIDPSKFPKDFGSFFRYSADLERLIPERYEPPDPLTLDELDQFVATTEGRYDVEWC